MEVSGSYNFEASTSLVQGNSGDWRLLEEIFINKDKAKQTVNGSLPRLARLES